MMRICLEWSVDRDHVAKYSAHHQVICIFWNAAADFLPATIIYPVTQRENATYSTWDLWKGVSWSILWCMCGRTVVFHQWVLPFGLKWHKKVWQIMTGYPPPYFVLPNHTVCPAHWPTVIRHLIYSFQSRCKAGRPLVVSARRSGHFERKWSLPQWSFWSWIAMLVRSGLGKRLFDFIRLFSR